MNVNEDNASRFIRAMTGIEDFLRDKIQRSKTGDYDMYFSELIDRSTDLAPQQKTRLKKYVKLRNAVTHDPRDPDGRAIADPRDDTVLWAENQLQMLTKPPLVYSVLKMQPPEVLAEHTNLVSFLDLVKNHDFSQTPVRTADDDLWLITTNAVTRWLASEYISGDGALLESSTVGQMRGFTEDGDRLVIRSKNLTAVEAVRVFAGSTGSAPPTAILLTNSGKAKEKPLGICSRADVADLLKALGV